MQKVPTYARIVCLPRAQMNTRLKMSRSVSDCWSTVPSVFGHCCNSLTQGLYMFSENFSFLAELGNEAIMDCNC